MHAGELTPGRRVWTWRRDWSVVEAKVVRIREFPGVTVEVELDGRSWEVDPGSCQATKALALLAASESARRAGTYRSKQADELRQAADVDLAAAERLTKEAKELVV